jgi:phosphatidylglycerol:prolipoprotein diacylglycerol transferase
MLTYPNISPIAFKVGPLAVRWYGIAYLISILIAWFLTRRRIARQPGYGFTAEHIDDLIFYAALGLILGGRIGYVLFYNLPSYLHDFTGVFRVWEGGMSFHGGLLGCLAGVAILMRRLGKRFFDALDLLAPVVPIGLFFGRLGNFANGELWGAPTALPWGMVFPDPSAGGVPRHPSQLYEAFLEGMVLFAALWFFARRPRPRMAVSGMFLLLYGIFRFAVEFVRVPDAQLGYLAWNWLTMGQALSLPMIVVGLLLIALAYRPSARSLAPR